MTLKVLKVWNDNGDTANQPSSVTVQLLKDGKVEKSNSERRQQLEA